MTMSRRRFIAIAACCTLATASGGAQPLDGARWRGVALGAETDLRIVGMTSARAERLIAMARTEIDRLEQQFSLYRPDSALVSLNRTGVLADPSADLLELLSLAGSVHRASDGLFDPTVQPLWAAHAQNGGRLSDRQTRAALARIGWRKMAISPRQVRLPPGGALTLNGIAQGFITDRVVALLKASGLNHALVNVGEISAIGRPVGLEAWPVRLHAPGSVGRTIGLRDRAVATSSALGTTLDAARSRSHIIDPRTGRPARTRWRRISVLHHSAALADGLSTAGVLMDPDRLTAMIRRFEGAACDALSRDGATLSL